MCHSCASSSPDLFLRKRESSFVPIQVGTYAIWGSWTFWMPAFAGMTQAAPHRPVSIGQLNRLVHSAAHPACCAGQPLPLGERRDAPFG